jgi:hypothetical protein
MRINPLLLTLAFALTACGTPQTVINSPVGGPDDSSSASSNEVASEAASEDSNDSEPAQVNNDSRPPSVRIDLAFASQAPTGNWNPPYDEACEEASLIIVHHYLQGTPLNANIMNQDILDMVKYEESKGLPIDIDMHELAGVAEDKLGYDTDVVEGADVTIERIESELANGNPVIVPLAGQDIGNPNYSGAGPPYHVLVIVGYDAKNFITHDVGTRKGEYYTYRKQVIMDAIHDWNGSVDTIRSGPRRLLVVTK